MIADAELTKQEKITLLKAKIRWIDRQEKMFNITSIMNLERVLLREELERISGNENINCNTVI